MKKMILLLLALSSVAQSDELDSLINSANNIVDQINKGILLSGAALEYSYEGGYLSNGQLSTSAHITNQQLEAYNTALIAMNNFQPYGNVEDVLQLHAAEQLELMNNAVDTFTDVVVEMIQVVEVVEIASEASTPDEKAEVQEFVATNQEVLTISQEQVETYNQSVDDIEIHANNASVYLGVAANQEAVDFLQTGAENNNSNANNAALSYNASMQRVSMQWEGTNNATAVYVNGTNFGLDFYVSEADILTAGEESELYLTGPTYLGYQCFMYGQECN